VNDQLKSISAVRPKRESGSSRMKRKRGGENVGWKRIVRDRDDLTKKFGISPEFLNSPITRWVYFRHLTKTQGEAARHYADIMRKFDRFHGASNSRPAPVQRNAQVNDGGQGPGQCASNGTTDQYWTDARKAMRQHKKLQKIIAPFYGAKEMLDRLCVLEIEPPENQRKSCAAVLSLVAKAFGIDEAYRIRRSGP